MVIHKVWQKLVPVRLLKNSHLALVPSLLLVFNKFERLIMGKTIEEQVKIITIEIESAPRGYLQPIIKKMKYPPLQIPTSLTDGLDITTLDERVIVRDCPLSHFAVDGNKKSFYIREKDKQAFLALVKGWESAIVKKAQEEAVSGLISFVFACTQPDNGDEFSTVDTWVSTYINCKGDFNEYLKTLK